MNETLIPKKAIKELCKGEDTIEQHIDNLHDLILNWLDQDFIYNQDVKNSMFHTYHSLREFLKQLKPLATDLK